MGILKIRVKIEIKIPLIYATCKRVIVNNQSLRDKIAAPLSASFEEMGFQLNANEITFFYF